MMDFVLTTLSTIFGSGVLGMAAGFIQKWLDMKKSKLDFDQKTQIMRLEHHQHMEELNAEARLSAKIVDMETDAKKSIAEIHRQALVDQVNADVQLATIEHDTVIGKSASQWVINVRAITRAALTWLCVLGMFAFAFFTIHTASAVAETVFLRIEAMAATAFAWWFTRASLSKNQ